LLLLYGQFGRGFGYYRRTSDDLRGGNNVQLFFLSAYILFVVLENGPKKVEVLRV
jgi:hypothetical protein